MRILIWMSLYLLFLLGSCGQKADSHDDHRHETTSHNHSHEGHNHDHEEHDHEGHDHDHERHDHDHATDGHKEENQEIIMTPDQAKAAGVEVNTITPVSFHAVIKTSGQVLAAQGNEQMAVANVTGIVRWSRAITEGMEVRPGETLLRIASSRLAEGDPAEKAKVNYEAAKAEYERIKQLADDRIVSAKEFAAVKQRYENARIAYEATAENHDANGQAVKAPLGGFIKELLVKEGDYVTVGQPLMSISQHKRLYLRADVSERDYAALKEIETAHFCTPYQDRVYELKALNGRLLSYGKAAGGESNYLPVTFEFDNRGSIVPGSFVEVYLLTRTRPEVIALPKGALTEEQGSYFVYIQVDEEGYEKRRVTLGADDGLLVEIIDGVHSGERVVTQGAYQVKLAGASSAIPAHSHEH